MTDSKWASTYIPIAVQTLALIGVLYTTRTTRSVNLRKDRHDAYLEFVAMAAKGWRIVDDRSKEQNQQALSQLKTDFNEWLVSMDGCLARFELSAPNYVAYLGSKYYEAISHLYEEQIDQKSCNRTCDQFQRSARFDLRHTIWSYLASVFFLFWEIFVALVFGVLKFPAWMWSRRPVTWLRSRHSVQRVWSHPLAKWVRSRTFSQWLSRKYIEVLKKGTTDYSTI